MKNHRFFVYWTTVCLSLFLQRAAFAGDFKLVKQDASILLYERWIPNKGETVRELKAEFTVRTANPEKVLLLLKDEAKGLKWNNNAGKYQVIPGGHANAWRTYILYDTPWPMDDFDCLLNYRYEAIGTGTAIISFQSVTSSSFPVSENVNRIRGTRGKWMIQKQGDGLKITHLVTTDRDKSVPRWISDPIIHDNLFKTMTRFKNLLEKKS